MKGVVVNLLKLIGGVIALVIAFIFVFVLPGAGAEQFVVEAAGSILGVLGLTSWRNNYGIVKAWYQSKTIISAIVVMIGLTALGLITFFGFGLPAWVITVLTGIVASFGGSTLWGIFDAINKNKKSQLK